MENLLSILVAVLPPFLLLSVGAFARAVGWLRAEADASLSMVTIRILYPCFILFHIGGNRNSGRDQEYCSGCILHCAIHVWHLFAGLFFHHRIAL